MALVISWASLVAQSVKNMPAVQETRVRSLGWEDSLEKEMATHSSILVWKVPWTEETGRLQSMELQRVGCNWARDERIKKKKFPETSRRREGHVCWGLAEKHMCKGNIPNWLPVNLTCTVEAVHSDSVREKGSQHLFRLSVPPVQLQLQGRCWPGQ